MSLYILGDVHGDFGRLNTFINKKFPQKVICAGDFGFWPGHKEFELSRIKNKFTEVLWIDGNHECVTKDTEVLTELGWKNIAELNNTDLLAQFDIKTKDISFAKPIKYFKHKEDKILILDGPNTKQKVSLDHNIVYNNEFIKAEKLFDKKLSQEGFITSGLIKNDKYDISDNLLKMIVWIVCDSTIILNNKYLKNSKKIRIQFKLSREDKIKNLTTLLEDSSIEYTIKECKKNNAKSLQPYYIRIYGEYSKMLYSLLENGEKSFPSFFRKLNKRQVSIVLNEIIKTDGSLAKDRIILTSKSKKDIDFIQEIAILNNYPCTTAMRKQNKDTFGKNDVHIARISLNGVTNYKVTSDIVDYGDFVYCVTMPLGTIITRNEGKVAFTGNCHEKIQEIIGDSRELIQIQNTTYCPRGSTLTLLDGRKILFMGGASSIDKHWRTPGYDWFWQEDISYKDMEALPDEEIDIVISHTCPSSFLSTILPKDARKFNDPAYEYLEFILDKYKPKLWLFGHWHCKKEGFNKGCKWVALNESSKDGWFYKLGE